MFTKKTLFQNKTNIKISYQFELSAKFMPADQPQQPMMMMPPQQMQPQPVAPVQLVQNSDNLLMNRFNEMIRN